MPDPHNLSHINHKESIMNEINTNESSSLLFTVTNHHLFSYVDNLLHYAAPEHSETEIGKLWVHVKGCWERAIALHPRPNEDLNSDDWFNMRVMLDACYRDNSVYPPTRVAMVLALVQTLSNHMYAKVPYDLQTCFVKSCDTDSARSAQRSLEMCHRAVTNALRRRLNVEYGIQDYQIATYDTPPPSWYEIDQMPRYIKDARAVQQENEGERAVVDREITDSHTRILVNTYLTRLHQQNLNGLKFYYLSNLMANIRWALNMGPQIQFYQYTHNETMVRGVQYGSAQDEYRDWGFGA